MCVCVCVCCLCQYFNFCTRQLLYKTFDVNGTSSDFTPNPTFQFLTFRRPNNNTACVPTFKAANTLASLNEKVPKRLTATGVGAIYRLC
jgi:hypothetical protein